MFQRTGTHVRLVGGGQEVSHWARKHQAILCLSGKHLELLYAYLVFLPLPPGNSACLRRRYDALNGAAKQRQQVVKEGVTRRKEFDSCLESVVGTLDDIEGRHKGLDVGGDGQPLSVQEKVELVRVSLTHTHTHKKQKKTTKTTTKKNNNNKQKKLFSPTVLAVFIDLFILVVVVVVILCS